MSGESPAVGRIRFFGAGLSTIFGFVGLVSFLPIARGEASWAVAPGAVLLTVGGVYGLLAQLRSGDVNASRRAGFRALLWTVTGLLGFVVALMVTGG